MVYLVKMNAMINSLSIIYSTIEVNCCTQKVKKNNNKMKCIIIYIYISQVYIHTSETQSWDYRMFIYRLQVRVFWIGKFINLPHNCLTVHEDGGTIEKLQQIMKFTSIFASLESTYPTAISSVKYNPSKRVHCHFSRSVGCLTKGIWTSTKFKHTYTVLFKQREIQT